MLSSRALAIRKIKPTPRMLGISFDFPSLVICMLAVSANLGMVNKYVAIKLSDGTNLLALREVLVLLVLVIGIMRGRRYLKTAAQSWLIWPGIAIVALLPLGALAGFFNNGSILVEIARDTYSLSIWLIAWVIAANVRDMRTSVRLSKALVVIAGLVVIGAIIELRTGIKLVSSQPESFLFESITRSTPDGTILIITAIPIILICLIFSKKKILMNRWTLIGWLTLLAAFTFVSQIRTIYIAVAIWVTIFLVFLLFSPRRRRAVRLSLFILFFGLVALGVFQIFSKTVGVDKAEQIIERYVAVIKPATFTAIDNAGNRLWETEQAFIAWRRSPVWGVGLGTPYRDALLFYPNDPCLWAHNVLAHYAVKLGALGLGLFLLFCFAAFRSLYSSLKENSVLSILGIALASAVVIQIIAAFAMNVFGMIQQFPIAAVVVGLLAAQQRLLVEAKAGPRINEKVIWTSAKDHE